LDQTQNNEEKKNFGKGQKIDFPTRYNMRAVFSTDLEQEIQRRNLELVLEEVGVEYSDFKFRKSGKGNYVTISVDVTVFNEEQFKELYKKLRLLPGLKLAI